MFRSADFPRLFFNGRIQQGAPVAFPVALVGFMASGKSTLARMLGATLSSEVRDLDREIENRVGKTIPEIFSSQGEFFFRARETEILSEWLDPAPKEASSVPPYILATGGGVIIDPENRKRLTERAVTIFLDPPFDILYTRISAATAERPLALNRNRDDLFHLWSERRAWYKQASHLVLSENHTVSESVDQILNFFRIRPT